jgi:hypothetical protein
LCSSAIALRKEALISIGGFPVGVRSGEDLLTWMRMAARWPVAYCNQALAVFWMPSNVFDRPGRFEDVEDHVGRELEIIYAEANESNKSGVRAYLAVWHRMRAITFLQLGQRFLCLGSVFRALKFRGGIGRLSVILIIAIFPFSKPARLFFFLKNILESRRCRS